MTVALQGVPVALLWVILSHSQQLTHDRVNEMVSMGNTEIRPCGGGGGAPQTNSNPKCQDLPKFSFSGEGGLGVLQTNIPEILEWGTQGILSQKFYQLECVVHHR